MTASASFRQLLGSFATGVTVVTARHDERHVGMTASALASVSLDPPLLLVCVGRQARLHAALAAGANWVVNILSADQRALAERFSHGLDDPFSGVAYVEDEHGVPRLDGVVAHIACRPWHMDEAGDHSVFFGEVVSGDTFDRPPLLHIRSQYTRPDTT